MKGKKTSEKESFESIFRQLEDIVTGMENGSDNLENLVVNYKRGMDLLTLCRKKLSHAELAIEKASTKQSGHLETES